jgi:hypothetical protein
LGSTDLSQSKWSFIFGVSVAVGVFIVVGEQDSITVFSMIQVTTGTTATTATTGTTGTTGTTVTMVTTGEVEEPGRYCIFYCE